MTRKEAKQKEAEVFKEAAAVLEKTAAERDMYQARCEAYERRDRATKLASKVHEKGINDTPIPKLAEHFESLASTNSSELGNWERAVDLVGADMGRKMASLSNDQVQSAGNSELVDYLVNGG
jgi:uncharacterized protein (DUF924 family)